MGVTCAAGLDLPVEAREPRPDGRALSFGRAAIRGREAADDITNARRVHERVLMRAVDRCPRRLLRDAGAARGATEPTLLLDVAVLRRALFARRRRAKLYLHCVSILIASDLARWPTRRSR